MYDYVAGVPHQDSSFIISAQIGQQTNVAIGISMVSPHRGPFSHIVNTQMEIIIHRAKVATHSM